MPRGRKGNAGGNTRTAMEVVANNLSPGGDETARPREECSNIEEQGSGPHSRVAELQLQLQLAKFQAEENEKQRKHEREMLVFQSQRPTSIQTSSGNDVIGWGPERQIAYWQGILKPLVPDCDDNNADLIAFFKVVEGLFESYAIPQSCQGKLVIPLLKSRGTPLLVQMTGTELNDYGKIKKAVLSQNRLSSTEQRMRYLNARRTRSETYGQFAERLRMLWGQYLQGKGADTAEQISEIVVCDQFRETLSPEVRKYVDLQSGAKAQTIRELAAIADVHRLAHASGHPEGSVRERHGLESPNQPKRSEYRAGKVQGPEIKSTRSGKPREGVEPLGCFACGGDHLVKVCPHKMKSRQREGRQPAGQMTQWNDRGRISPPGKAKAQRVRVEAQGSSIDSEQSESECMTARVGAKSFVTNGAESKVAENTEEQTTDYKARLQRVMVQTPIGQKISAIIDSGCELTVIHSDFVDLETVEERGSVILQPALGQSRKAKLVELELCLDVEEGAVRPYVRVLAAATPELNEPLLLTIHDFNAMEEQANKYSYESFENGESNCLEGDSSSHTEWGSGTESARKTSTIKGGSDEWDLQDLFKEGETTSSLVVAAVSVGESNEGTDCTDGVTQASDGLSDVAKLKREQEACPTLSRAWKMEKLRKGGYFCRDGGLLYHTEKVQGYTVAQLVLPKDRRKVVLHMAHETAFGGHLGVRKTAERIRYSFYWDGLRKDVTSFVNSCEDCQRRRVVRTADRVPIEPVQRPALPFQVVNVDLIGPIDPPARSHKYILCLVDQHSRWLEAIPLRNLSAQSTCDALLTIFMRVGLPQVVATDGGSNFAAALTQEFHRLIGVSPRISTPGRPESNGLVERLNRVVKSMLHHVIREHPKDWDRQLPFITWAYNEVSSATTGHAPFRLLYGREPCGPLSILRQTWDGSIDAPQVRIEPVHAYLKALKKRMEQAIEEANVISFDNQRRYAEYYNRRSKLREFKEGDQVLVLTPDSTNRLLARWIGPVRIIRRYPPHSYLVEMPNQGRRRFHADKLRPFVVRSNVVGVIFDDDIEMGEVSHVPMRKDQRAQPHTVKIPLELTCHLSSEATAELTKLVGQFPQLFSGNLRRINVGEHRIRLKPGATFKRPHLYRVPEALKSAVDEQIDELIERQLIGPSESEFVHPVVCVKKKDGSIRLCVDYRALNEISEGDQFPMEQVNELLYEVGRSQYITVLDMQKAYWQVTLESASREYTSFATHRGLYAWKVLPFGLKGAPATFQRIINRVLSPHRRYARAYIDDVAIFSDSWSQHIDHLQKVFTTLEKHQFSVNLTKTVFAQAEVKYLGHIVGSGHHRPDPAKLEAIEGICPPTTKRDLRKFLGLCNYYRNYIDRFAEFALPLTELTRKRIPTKIPWTQESQKSFELLKAALKRSPNLYTPDISQPFTIYCDASDEAVAGCLTQKDKDGHHRPIAFTSAKLTTSQQKWSISEREAYAVVFSLKKFEPWIFGTKVEVVTDHNPLTFLTAHLPQSAKLQRWSLALQRFDLVVKYRRGAENTNADALSRLPNLSWECGEPLGAREGPTMRNTTSVTLMDGTRSQKN